MDTEPINHNEPYEKILSQTASLDDILIQIAQNLGIADHKFTKEEIEEARGNLSPMNDRVAMVTFADNKNNHIITGTVNALRKIHNVIPIPPIEQTWLQELSLPDVLGRGMIADMISEGWQINVATEIQKGSQADFAVRGTLSSSNIMRRQFKSGEDFSEAPDTIGVYILGFNLPELADEKMFVSRIVRANYDSGKHFLADKYSDFYIELEKVSNWKKSELPEQYHEIWDICMILKTKIKDQEDVIKMQAVQSPLALDLARETRKAVAPDDFMNDTMRRERGLNEIQIYMQRREQKAEQKAEERVLIMALRNNVPSEIIEVMRKGIGITDVRFAELQKQAQMN
ncbi:MAG: PD-(D/E)XK nuclease family transposase [Defluviitaleaceae bacterium]|nr:PD-(D/E)XK nuclease family transposase [Defluviitaleaceae bacterium]